MCVSLKCCCAATIEYFSCVFCHYAAAQIPICVDKARAGVRSGRRTTLSERGDEAPPIVLVDATLGNEGQSVHWSGPMEVCGPPSGQKRYCSEGRGGGLCRSNDAVSLRTSAMTIIEAFQSTTVCLLGGWGGWGVREALSFTFV